MRSESAGRWLPLKSKKVGIDYTEVLRNRLQDQAAEGGQSRVYRDEGGELRRTRGWKREDMAPWARVPDFRIPFGRAVTYRICLLGVWRVSGQPYWTPIRSGSGSGVMGVVGTVSKGGEVGETPSKLCAVATLLSRGGRGSPPQLRKLGAVDPTYPAATRATTASIRLAATRPHP